MIQKCSFIKSTKSKSINIGKLLFTSELLYTPLPVCLQFYSYEMILKTLKLLNSDENGGKAIFRVFRVLTWTNSEIQGFQGHLLSFQGFQGHVDTLLKPIIFLSMADLF